MNESLASEAAGVGRPGRRPREGAEVGCGVCGAEVPRDAASATLPDIIAGQPLCEWCETRLAKLQARELSASGFASLLSYAKRGPNASLPVALEQLWEESSAEVAVRDVARSEAETAHARALAALPTTSGFSFDGFRIASYLDFVSAEIVLGMGIFRGIGADFADIFGAESQGLRRRLTEAKTAALDRLRGEVLDRGGNAIIGIDLDYTMFGTSLVGVIASGTAVVIEKLD